MASSGLDTDTAWLFTLKEAKEQITGHDLLATGQCGTCGRYGCATAGRVSWT